MTAVGWIGEPTPRGEGSGSDNAWVPSVEELRFVLGGRNLKTVRLKAVTRNIPFTRLSPDLERNIPVWKAFPDCVEAAVIPAQPVDAEPQRLTLLQDHLRYVTVSSIRFFLDLRGTFAQYLQKFNAKQRYNLTREVRKFAEFSGARIECRTFLSSEEMKEFYRYASQVSSNSWKEEIGGPGFGGTVGEAAALNLAKAGLARGYVLFHEQKPVAYVFCRSNHEHLIYKHIGYHREYRKWSPGTVLLYLMLERLFVEQKYEFLDLGEGTLGYKSFFSTQGIRCVRVIYFRRSLRNFIIVCAHAGLTEGSIAAGKILAKLKVKHAIKRTLMGKLYRPAQES